MKICFLTHNLDPFGGWGRFSDDLIFGVKASGIETVVLTERNDGGDSLPVLSRGASLLSAVSAARRYIQKCDIIHALDGYPYGVIANLANTGLKKKLVITAVGTYAVAPFYDWRYSFLLKRAYRAADRVISISSFTQTEIGRKVRLHNTLVINPGVNLEHFTQKREESNEQYIISVGALKYRKGHHVSIPAFALARREIKNLKYIIVGDQGDAAYYSLLRRLVKENNVERDVIFLEKISDDKLAGLYRSARLFILTSVNHNHRFEGFGLVFLEAAASGLPVLGTTGNGIEDSVNTGANGYLVPQNDINEAARQIVNIIQNKNEWQRMSEQSYQWAKHHDQRKSVLRYIDEYRAILTK